jgi:hypothetical protein
MYFVPIEQHICPAPDVSDRLGLWRLPLTDVFV